MNAIVMPPPNSLKSASRQRWDRMEGETHRAYSAHIAYRDIGSDRTIQKAADLLQKSGSVLRRWSLRFDWKNRAADFDAYIEGELQRRLLARRAHARERALATAEMLDEKVCEAVRMLKVAKVVKVEGRPDEVTLLITPGELARLFEVSYRVQTAILGDGKEDRAAAIYVNIGTADPKYAFEQPAAMQEARRKARQANQLM
jgi:hypothetical protein